MDAYYFWQSKDFNLMNVLSVLSLSYRTKVNTIYIYFDFDFHPNNIYWTMISFIPKVMMCPLHKKYKNFVQLKEDIGMKSVFENSILMNFALMSSNCGYTSGFDSFYLKDITDIKNAKPFFGNGDIYLGLIKFNEYNCPIRRIVKKIIEKKYTYEQTQEFIKKKFANSKNTNIIWQHWRDKSFDEEKYVVDFRGEEGFQIFEEEDFHIFLNEDLLKDIKQLIKDCKRGKEYFAVASMVHL